MSSIQVQRKRSHSIDKVATKMGKFELGLLKIKKFYEQGDFIAQELRDALVIKCTSTIRTEASMLTRYKINVALQYTPKDNSKDFYIEILPKLSPMEFSHIISGIIDSDYRGPLSLIFVPFISQQISYGENVAVMKILRTRSDFNDFERPEWMVRGTDGSAGYDVVLSKENVVIPAHSSKVFTIDLKFGDDVENLSKTQTLKDFDFAMKSRSSFMLKGMFCFRVYDEDAMKVSVVNTGLEDVEILADTRYAQLIPYKRIDLTVTKLSEPTIEWMWDDGANEVGVEFSGNTLIFKGKIMTGRNVLRTGYLGVENYHYDVQLCGEYNLAPYANEQLSEIYIFSYEDYEIDGPLFKILPIEILKFNSKYVLELDDTERGSKGFGSTGLSIQSPTHQHVELSSTT
jgi:hypothetical protein